MFSLGIDSGSTMTKGVLFDGMNVVGCHMLPTSIRPGEILRDIYDRLYTEDTGFVEYRIWPGAFKGGRRKNHGNHLPRRRRLLSCPRL